MRGSIVETVCRIPRLLEIERDKSIVELVAASGYLQHPDALTVDAIADYLRDHPELIDKWLMYSGDKRTGSGWYFDEVKRDLYVVGFHPGEMRTEYADRRRACAEFVWRELGALASDST